MDQAILTPSFWMNLEILPFGSLLIASNFLMYLFCMTIIKFVRKNLVQYDLNQAENKITKHDFHISLQVLATNILVGFLGFLLLKINFIQFQSNNIKTYTIDLLYLFLVIDFIMFILHLIIHKTMLYLFLHQGHHQHESMNEISLYVMNPLEALGFGLILIALLILKQVTIPALLTFLFINWLLGVLAHSGIEPSKGKLGNYFCMNRFHQIHHESPTSNYGFYTPFWDMIFKTRKYQLLSETNEVDS